MLKGALKGALRYSNTLFSLTYAGMLVIIAAMGWLFREAYINLDGPAAFAISSSYSIIFTLLGTLLWRKFQLKQPGGLLITLAVCTTPLVLYSLQKWLHIWVFVPGPYHTFYDWVSNGGFAIEIATLITGLIVLYFVRFTVLTVPLAIDLWFMSQDLSTVLFHSFHPQSNSSIIFGLLMLIVAYIIDHRTELDYAFWIYLIGIIAFWVSLSGITLDYDSEILKLSYFLINLTMVCFSMFLRRRVLLIFGIMGVICYVLHFSYFFQQSVVGFTIMLTFFGLVMIATGIIFSRYYGQIEQWIDNFPKWLLKFRPQDRQPTLIPMNL